MQNININLNVICPTESIVIEELETRQVQAKYGAEAANEIAFCMKVKPQEQRQRSAKANPLLQSITGLANKTVEKTSSSNNYTYNIVVNKEHSYRIYKQSWIRKQIPFDVFKLALKIHELSHIRYSKFDDYKPGDFEDNKLFLYIQNLLDDAMIEYRLSLDFPEYAQYFSFLLASISTSLDNATMVNQPVDRIQELSRQLFLLTRFDVIETNADIDFINEILPLVIMSRRGKYADIDAAARVITNLIIVKQAKENQQKMEQRAGKSNEFNHWAEVNKEDVAQQAMESANLAAKKIKIEQKAITNKDLKQINESADKDIVGDALKDKVKDLNQKASMQQISITAKEKSKFFMDTATKHAAKIEEIRKTFMRAFSDHKVASAYDGDLNIRRQQQAYMNSILHEEAKDYQYTRLEKVKLDVVIMRDVSGSTAGFMQQYAEAVVILLSALENIEGIRTAEIDFGPYSKENKSFETDIEKSMLSPEANGGTQIYQSFEKVLQYDFKGKKNLVFIISDGDISYDARNANLEKQIASKASIIKIAIGNYSKADYKKATIEDLPIELSKIILEEVLVC